MKTRTLYPPVEVFDDPEFCQNKDGSESCRFVAYDWDKKHKYCPIFGNTKMVEFDLSDDPNGLGTIKCQQCKDLFKSALSGEG